MKYLTIKAPKMWRFSLKACANKDLCYFWIVNYLSRYKESFMRICVFNA